MTRKNSKDVKKSDENKKLKPRIEPTSTNTTVKPRAEELATKMHKEEKIGENRLGVRKTKEKAVNIDQNMMKGTSPVGKIIRKSKVKENLKIKLLKKLEKPSFERNSGNTSRLRGIFETNLIEATSPTLAKCPIGKKQFGGFRHQTTLEFVPANHVKQNREKFKSKTNGPGLARTFSKREVATNSEIQEKLEDHMGTKNEN